jgi:cysteinyl-tRNA synthetase
MNFELLFGVVAVVCIALTIWSNESWYRTCQSMNDEWYKRVINITMVQDKILEDMQKDITGFRTTQDMMFERMQKRIDELEDKLEDDGR